MPTHIHSSRTQSLVGGLTGTQEHTRPLQAPPVDRCLGISTEGHQHIPVVPFKEHRHHLNTLQILQTTPQTTQSTLLYERQEDLTDLSLRAKQLHAAEHHPDVIHHQRTVRHKAVQLICDDQMLPVLHGLSPYTTHREVPAHTGKVRSATLEEARLPSGRKQLMAITPRHCLSLASRPLQATLLCHKDPQDNRD